MSRALLSLVLVTSVLVTACAGNRENLADTATAATTTAPATALAAAPAGEAVSGGTVAVVDGNQLAQRSTDTLLCRDLLVHGSNMQRRMCGTAAQWKDYERREALAAGEMVRRMQRGGPPDEQFPGRRR
jgi:hypothetical protein